MTRVATIDAYRAQPPHARRRAGGRRTPRGDAASLPCLVTVVTVSFNSSRTIAATLDSIRAQTHSAVEYVVIDGGSTDGTVDLLAVRDADIDLWVSEPDRGISDAFNKGIALGSGEFVAIVNSDDWIEPDHLATAVAQLRQTGADFVFGDLVLHSGDGRKVHHFIGEPGYAERIAHFMPFLNHPTVVCRRSCFEKIGLFDPDLKTAMDYDWFLRLHLHGATGVYCPRLVAHMTLEGQSDRNFKSALREVRIISIRHGYPPAAAWMRYAYRVMKGTLRRRVQSWLPRAWYESLRRTLNANYRSGDDRAR